MGLFEWVQIKCSQSDIELLQAQNSDQQKEIDKLREDVEALKAELSELKDAMDIVKRESYKRF